MADPERYRHGRLAKRNLLFALNTLRAKTRTRQTTQARRQIHETDATFDWTDE